MLTGKGLHRIAVPGVEVIVCPSGKPRWGLSTLFFVRWVRGQLREGGFDASLSVTSWLPGDVVEPRSGVIAEIQKRLIARRTSPGGQIAKRFELFISPKQHIMRWLERRQFTGTRVKKVVAISRYVAEQLDRHYGLNGARVALIPNAAVVQETDAVAARARVRAELELSDETIMYLFVTTDPIRKGMVPLLEAMRRLNGRNVALVVAGEVPPHLRELAADLKLRGTIRFLGAVEDVSGLYCAADVTVLPTYYDPASKVIIESLMLGTPAITSAYNGARDFIDGNGGPACGRIVDEPHDIDGLTRAMTELADPVVRKRCSAATAGLADRLSMRRHVDGLETVLRDVARKQPG